MQTLPRLFCRFRRFWFSQKYARFLFFLLRGSEILRQNAAKRCVAAVGKVKKSGSSGKSCVCCASQKKQDKPLAPDAKCRLWAIDAAAVCPPPSDLWHFQPATSSPYRVYRPPLFLHLFHVSYTLSYIWDCQKTQEVERFVKRAQRTNLFGLCRATETKVALPTFLLACCKKAHQGRGLL